MVVYATHHIQFLICHNISEGILSWPSSVILYLYISVTSSGTTALPVANLCDYIYNVCIYTYISLCSQQRMLLKFHLLLQYIGSCAMHASITA